MDARGDDTGTLGRRVDVPYAKVGTGRKRLLLHVLWSDPSGNLVRSRRKHASQS